MLFSCQHHSWEVWPGQGKAPLMVLNKFPWVPAILWQQELAPGICFFSAWGTRATRAGRLLHAWLVPCWAFCWLGQGMRLWLSAGEAALGDPSAWECHSRDLLFETGQAFLPLILLPYLTAAFLCWSSGSVFPRIQPGLQKPARWHGHSHTSGKCHSPLPLQPPAI